jgi:hypothetical protein
MKTALYIFVLSLLTISVEATEKFLHMESNYSLNTPWKKVGKSDSERVEFLLNYLSKSKKGREIIEKTVQKIGSKKITEVIKVGEGSITDTTLTRKFSPHNPHEMTYESHSTVFINSDLKIIHAVLDLAHELVHFNEREAFNPYTSSFTPKEFVQSTVEGRGGEVDAYMRECEVRRELFSPTFAKSHCSKILDNEGQISKDLTIKHFYQLGSDHQAFQNRIKNLALSDADFPHVSSNEAYFISSAYGQPYPVAAIMEFESIMSKACKNENRRLTYLKENRAPASLDLIEDFKQNLAKRCHSFL